jgi:hypothetical protein
MRGKNCFGKPISFGAGTGLLSNIVRITVRKIPMVRDISLRAKVK